MDFIYYYFIINPYFWFLAFICFLIVYPFIQRRKHRNKLSSVKSHLQDMAGEIVAFYDLEEILIKEIKNANNSEDSVQTLKNKYRQIILDRENTLRRISFSKEKNIDKMRQSIKNLQ